MYHMYTFSIFKINWKSEQHIASGLDNTLYLNLFKHLTMPATTRDLKNRPYFVGSMFVEGVSGIYMMHKYKQWCTVYAL
jgi:hypothetical protein